ncbi:MAG: hypothetical protein R3E32_01505 [Chitinophagales bacterium]
MGTYNDNVTINENTDLSVVVRIQPDNYEVSVELPAQSTGKQVIDSLIEEPSLGISRINQEGQPYIFRLVSKGTGVQIQENVTLLDAGVKHNDTLLLFPVIEAGGI